MLDPKCAWFPSENANLTNGTHFTHIHPPPSLPQKCLLAKMPSLSARVESLAARAYLPQIDLRGTALIFHFLVFTFHLLL